MFQLFDVSNKQIIRSYGHFSANPADITLLLGPEIFLQFNWTKTLKICILHNSRMIPGKSWI